MRNDKIIFSLSNALILIAILLLHSNTHFPCLLNKSRALLIGALIGVLYSRIISDINRRVRDYRTTTTVFLTSIVYVQSVDVLCKS